VAAVRPVAPAEILGLILAHRPGAVGAGDQLLGVGHVVRFGEASS
jgi:hypothetical protein